MKTGSLETRKDIIGETRPNDDDFHRMRSAAWHKENVFMIRIDDIISDWERQFITNIGNREYGKRV